MEYTNTCHTHNLCRTENATGRLLAPGWRLAAGETIVVSGRTPPASAYFSFTNYLYSRYHPTGWRTNATLERRLVSCPPGPSRCEIFAGVNDPLNYLTVKTDGPSAFDSPFSFILAADSASEAAVASLLAQHGAVNTIRFPGAILQQGVSKGDEDELLNVMRVEGIISDAERIAFYSSPSLRVWRVTPPASFVVHDSDKFGSFEGRMRHRWTGVGEHVGNTTMAELQDALAHLQKRVSAKHAVGLFEKDVVSLDFTSFVKDSGYECLADGTQCQGDCRDTIYARATLLVEDSLCNATHAPCKPSRRSPLTDASDDALFVIGVNHQLTSHSVYSSLTALFPEACFGSIAGCKWCAQVHANGERSQTARIGGQVLSRGGQPAVAVPVRGQVGPQLLC